MPRSVRPRGFLPAVLLLACGFQESNAIDLPRIEGSPVVLTNVRMAESVAAVLGNAPTHIGSTSRPNAIGVAYDVTIEEAAPAYSGVSSRLTCRVGEHAIVRPLATDASGRLAAAAVGSKLEQRDTFVPTAFSDGVPEVCEATLVYAIAPPLASVPAVGSSAPPAPGPTLVPIGTVCFAGGELAEGACGADVLPRIPASMPVEASEVVGRIGETTRGGWGVAVDVLVTAGEDVPESFTVGADAACEGDARPDAVPLTLLMLGRDLRPGESRVQSGAMSPAVALAQEPAWCTVTVRIAEDGAKRSLREVCVRGEETTEGPCTA